MWSLGSSFARRIPKDLNTAMFCSVLKIVVWCCLLGAAPAYALRFYVDGTPAANDTTPSVGDDRRSLQSAQDTSTPLKTITQALRLAHIVSEGRPHVIQIAPGTYAPSRGETFPLMVTDPNIYFETTGLTVFDAENKSNHLQVTSATPDFVVAGIDFVNGLSDSGGAIKAKSCSLRVVNCRFFDNRATVAGHVLYSQDGRLQFSNNVVRNNGSSHDAVAVVEIHHTFADTTQRDRIRNNTFYRNSPPAILSSGNRTDVNSNIFLDPGAPALRDQSSAADPLIRYNLFWETNVLYISDQSDTIQVAKALFDTLQFEDVGISVPSFMTVTPPVKTLRTVVDTVTLEELGVRIPPFVTNVPDTLTTVDKTHIYNIKVSGDSSHYSVKAINLPATASTALLEQKRKIEWNPTLNDTGRNRITVQITDSVGAIDTLEYHLAVFTAPNFPDTSIFIPVLNDTGRTIGMATEDIRIEVPVTVGQDYNFEIEVTGNRSAYNFNPLILPTGASSADVDDLGEINWTPTIADTGSNQIKVEIIDPTGNLGILDYKVRVFASETFPDTSQKADIITATVVQDTTNAVNLLNALLPSFSSAASAGGNVFANPVFLDTTINRFELIAGQSPAIDAGDPAVALRDGLANRNDMGTYGGPVNSGAPTAGSFNELKITTLPDSVATEGQVYTFDVTLDPNTSINLVDLIQGPPNMASAFGKRPPIQWTPTISDTGTYQIGVIVYTNSGQGRQYYPLRVRPLNDNPAISSHPGLTALEDSLYSYSIAATDANGDTLSYSLVSSPQAMSVDSTSGLVQWLPAQADVGTAAVTVRVDDGKGGFALQEFTLMVLNTNDIPQLTSAPDSTATEDVLFTYTVVATDADPADTLSYSVTSGPTAATIDSNGLFSWTPVQTDVGTQQITVRAFDGNGGVVDQAFSVVVAEVDDPPVISSTPDTVASEDVLYTYAVSAVDEEGGKLTFELSSAPAGMSIDTTGTILWTPVAADTGIVAVKIRIRDPGRLESTQSYQLQILPVNDPPTISQRSPADSLVIATANVTIPISATVEDEENDALFLSWLVNGSSQATGSQFAFTPSATTIDTVSLQAIDSADTTIAVWIIDSRKIARISLAIDAIDFGDVGLGDTTQTILTVGNTGRVDLQISDLSLGNLQFGANFRTPVVSAGGETSLEILFSPAVRGSVESYISFTTNDPDRTSISVPLQARGVVPTTVAFDLDATTGSQGLTATAIAPGESVSVAIYATDVLSLVSYDLILSYDTEIFSSSSFSLNTTSEHNLLGVIGNTVTDNSSSSGANKFKVSVSTQAGAAGVSGSGLLGVVVFQVSSSIVPTGQATIIGLEEAIFQSSDQSAADSVSSGAQVELTLRSALPGDFNFDGVVNFDDFFLFADHFGATPSSPDWDRAYDLNQTGSSINRIDFDDFFLFIDGFGASAKDLPSPEGPADLRLISDLESGRPDQVDIDLIWSGRETLRGFVVAIEYDPETLAFRTYQPAVNREPLPWIQRGTGQVQVAVGLSSNAEAFAGDDLGRLEFDRLKPEATSVRMPAALGYDGRRAVTLGSLSDLRVEALPTSFLLFPPFPNPFNPETVIRYFLPNTSTGSVRIYDLLGRRVKTLFKGKMSAGYHRLTWSGKDDSGRQVATGIFLILLEADDHRRVHKLMLLK